MAKDSPLVDPVAVYRHEKGNTFVLDRLVESRSIRDVYGVSTYESLMQRGKARYGAAIVFRYNAGCKNYQQHLVIW